MAQADEYYRLNTKLSTLVIRADEGSSPLFLYYGARSLRKRSILIVCEHFEDECNAEITFYLHVERA